MQHPSLGPNRVMRQICFCLMTKQLPWSWKWKKGERGKRTHQKGRYMFDARPLDDSSIIKIDGFHPPAETRNTGPLKRHTRFLCLHACFFTFFMKGKKDHVLRMLRMEVLRMPGTRAADDRFARLRFLLFSEGSKPRDSDLISPHSLTLKPGIGKDKRVIRQQLMLLFGSLVREGQMHPREGETASRDQMTEEAQRKGTSEHDIWCIHRHATLRKALKGWSAAPFRNSLH